jgi:hypothetical protein
MSFSEAEFNAVVQKINKGMDDLSGKISEVPPAANSAMNHWYIPDYIKAAIKWSAEKIVELANWIWDKIKEVLKGVAAPVYFFINSFDWQDVRGLATKVGGQLKPNVLTTITNTWKGTASTAYGKVIMPQGVAADRIGAVCDKVSTALQICAGAGLVFYVAIAAILVKFIAALVTCIGLYGSAVLSWAGLALTVEEAGVNSALIWAAIGALSAALGTQVQQLITVHGELEEVTAFPGDGGGHWPKATTGGYSDGTVTDGDADWSLAK